MLACGAAKRAADLADQRVACPQRTGLIQEVAHLRCHVAESRRGTEHYGIVILELVRLRYRSGLVETKARRCRNFRRGQLGYPLDGHSSTGHPRGPFSLGSRHGLDVSVAAVVDDEEVGHGVISQ